MAIHLGSGRFNGRNQQQHAIDHFFFRNNKKTEETAIEKFDAIKKKSRPLWGRFFYDFLLLNFFFEMESVSGG